MRIRNRSCSAVLSSRRLSEKGCDRTFPDELEDKEEKFLLPLVAAAPMDAQQAQDDNDQVDDVAAHTVPGTGTGVVRHRAHKWRDILLGFNAGNSESCKAIKVNSWEGAEKPKFKRNKITVRNKGDNISFLENEDMNPEVVEKENPSSSYNEEATIASDYRECDSPRLGRSENDFMSRKHEHSLLERGDVCTIKIKNKRRRTKNNRSSRDDIESINAWRPCAKKSFLTSEDEVEIQALDKPMANNNSHVGSQCGRRNGRGWRCSQRTLVGYSLCEHHLGKGRLRSINNGTVVVNKNVPSKFKELLVLDASSSNWKVELDQHDQGSKKRSLKLIN